MDENKRAEGYEDALEEEIFELESFIHAKGLDRQLEQWRKSADYEDDLKSYEQYIKEEAEKIDTETMRINEDR
jgi:hypothetical protein